MKVLNRRCAGLDVHKDEVVACVRLAGQGEASHALQRFATTTRGLLELADWLEASEVTQVAMEATGRNSLLHVKSPFRNSRRFTRSAI